MKRKFTFLTLCAVLFALCFSAEAQQPKVYRVGETPMRARLLAELFEFSIGGPSKQIPIT